MVWLRYLSRENRESTLDYPPCGECEIETDRIIFWNYLLFVASLEIIVDEPSQGLKNPWEG